MLMYLSDRSAGRFIYLYIDQITIFQTQIYKKTYTTNESPFRFIFHRPINDSTFQRGEAQQARKIRIQSKKKRMRKFRMKANSADD